MTSPPPARRSPRLSPRIRRTDARPGASACLMADIEEADGQSRRGARMARSRCARAARQGLGGGWGHQRPLGAGLAVGRARRVRLAHARRAHRCSGGDRRRRARAEPRRSPLQRPRSRRRRRRPSRSAPPRPRKRRPSSPRREPASSSIPRRWRPTTRALRSTKPNVAASGSTPMNERRIGDAAAWSLSDLGRHRRRRPRRSSGRGVLARRGVSAARSFFSPPRRIRPISARRCRRRFSRAKWTSTGCP